jgi:hypothetical protein
MLLILATQEVEIRRIEIQGQSRQIVGYLENTECKKKSAGGVDQVVKHPSSKSEAEFKPQYHQKESYVGSWIGSWNRK